jgi:hypothetical protein
LIGVKVVGHQRGGDPGGRLLAELTATVAAALPPGADASSVIRREPYKDSCDGRAEARGWQAATVATRLATDLSPNELAAGVDSRIGGLGWRRTRSESAPGGAYFRWEKPLSTGTATLFLNSNESPHPDPAHPWALVATAPAVGEAVTGC